MTSSGQTPRFLAIVLGDKVMPSMDRMLSDNLDLRCLGPRTMTLVLSELNKRKLEVI